MLSRCESSSRAELSRAPTTTNQMRRKEIASGRLHKLARTLTARREGPQKCGSRLQAPKWALRQSRLGRICFGALAGQLDNSTGSLSAPRLEQLPSASLMQHSATTVDSQRPCKYEIESYNVSRASFMAAEVASPSASASASASQLSICHKATKPPHDIEDNHTIARIPKVPIESCENLTNRTLARPHLTLAGPGHWFDPDQLVVGNFGLSRGQQEAQMAIWCMWSAPLIMSNDLRHIAPGSAAILKNSKLIDVDQDELGVMALMVGSQADDDAGDILAFIKPVMPVKLGCPSFAVAYLSRKYLGREQKVRCTPLVQLAGPQLLCT